MGRLSLSFSTSETNRKIIAGIAVVSLFPFGGDEDLVPGNAAR